MENEWDDFVKCQKLLHVLFLDLISVEDEKSFYKNLVLKAKKVLKIDRMAIYLYNSKNNSIAPSWGINSKGEIDDISDVSEVIDNEQFFETLNHKDYIQYSDYTELYDRGNFVGRGWSTKSVFYSGHTPIGWICCDNLLSKKPISTWKKEILGELSRMTGEFIFNLRLENHLKSEVERKTLELKETQNNLIEAEKIASLGTLISGIAHEINTPIGVALTSVSHIKDKTDEINKKITGNILKKKELDGFISDTLFSSNLAVNSLIRTSELVNIFKQLSIDLNSNKTEEINLTTLIDNILLSINYTSNLEKVEIIKDIDKNIYLNCNPGNFYQIFNNLINNSISHGFINTNNPTITISGYKKDESIIIEYRDNGIGVPKELYKKIFEPFYTTKRSEGFTGLGLSIVYNSVIKLRGTVNISDNNNMGLKLSITL